MATVPHQFVTVAMGDLKPALIARARASRTSVSSLVRGFVALGLGASAPPSDRASSHEDDSAPVQVTIRMTAAEAHRFAAGAKRTGVTRAAYLAELIAGPEVAVDGATRRQQAALLVAANAEMSTLSRNLRHLATLLSQGSLPAALQYIAMLDDLADDVHRHVAASADLLAEMRSRRRVSASSARQAQSRRGSGHG